MSVKLSYDVGWKKQLKINLGFFQERRFASYLHSSKTRAVSKARNVERNSLSSSLCQQSSEWGNNLFTKVAGEMF